MESASLTTFVQGRHLQVITWHIAEWGQEDKLELDDVRNTREGIPEWGPRGQVGLTQDAT